MGGRMEVLAKWACAGTLDEVHTNNHSAVSLIKYDVIT
jgi:hypothetical protein